MGSDFMFILLIIGGAVLVSFVFIEKKAIRKAYMAAFVAQLITWPLGLTITSLGLIEYPVRLFAKATNSSFLHGFIMNPTIYAIYYIHYPKKAKLIWRVVYTLLISALPAVIEISENRYTDLVNYKGWNGYLTWLIAFISYCILKRFLDWFFKNAPKEGELNNET